MRDAAKKYSKGEKHQNFTLKRKEVNYLIDVS